MTSPGGGWMTRLVEDGDASEGRRRTNGKRRRRAARSRAGARDFCRRGIGPVQTGPAVDVTARRQHHGLARYLARADAARERAAERDRRRFGGPAGHRPRVARRRQFGDPRTVRQVRACLRTIRGGGGKRPRAPSRREGRAALLDRGSCARERMRFRGGPARAWPGGRGVPPEGARDLSARFLRPKTRDLPRFQRALFSGEHDLPSQTPGWVVLVCKSSCGERV